MFVFVLAAAAGRLGRFGVLLASTLSGLAMLTGSASASSLEITVTAFSSKSYSVTASGYLDPPAVDPDTGDPLGYGYVSGTISSGDVSCAPSLSSAATTDQASEDFVLDIDTIPRGARATVVTVCAELGVRDLNGDASVVARARRVVRVPALAREEEPEKPPPVKKVTRGRGGNRLWGARFFIDDEWGLAQRAYRSARGSTKHWLRLIADQPETKRFGDWTDDPQGELRALLERVQSDSPGRTLAMATYRLNHKSGCGGRSDSRREARSVARWYEALARGIGGGDAVVFVEIDALMTAHCLSRRGQAVRAGELRHAIRALKRGRHTSVYVDAAAGNGPISAGTAVRILRAAGISRADGFFVNGTHADWLSAEIRWGSRLSRHLGGKHFVVNTAVNGRGPLVPRNVVRDGNEVWCNPPGRGLGHRPTTRTGHRLVDAYMWIGNPGRSAGACNGGAPTGEFWIEYAVGLAKRARLGG